MAQNATMEPWTGKAHEVVHMKDFMKAQGKTDEEAATFEGFYQVHPEDEDAVFIASTLPSFEFKGVPAFFDVGGICMNPLALEKTIDIFEERYRGFNPPPDKICGLDARGFLFGPLVAQRLKIPFFMMRKEGKLPGPTMAVPYETEYSKEVLTVPVNSIVPGERVVIFDDLIATGGTTIAAANLIVECGGVVCDVSVVTAIAFFKGWEKFRNSLPQLADVPIFAIVECTKVPGMPEGSTETMTIKANSAEHRAIQAAMANAKPGDVICKTLDGCTVVYDTKPMSGLNTKYLEEGAD